MKKYQNWLENRHYKHHLDNLHKISHSKHPRTLQRSISTTKHNSLVSQNLRESRQDIWKKNIIQSSPKKNKGTYFIFYQNQSHNLTRINTEFDINQQNFRMANRLANVRPTVSRQKHREFYEKNQIITKKMMRRVPKNLLRQKSLNNFFASEKLRKIDSSQQYVLIIKFQQQQTRKPSTSICSYLPQERKNPFQAFFCSQIHENIWFMIDAGKEFHKVSENIPIWQIQNHSFVFGLKKPIKKSLVFSIYHSIKLRQDRKIGEYQLTLPNIGQSQKFLLNHPTKDGVSIQLKIIYGEINNENIKSELLH